MKKYNCDRRTIMVWSHFQVSSFTKSSMNGLTDGQTEKLKFDKTTTILLWLLLLLQQQSLLEKRSVRWWRGVTRTLVGPVCLAWLNMFKYENTPWKVFFLSSKQVFYAIFIITRSFTCTKFLVQLLLYILVEI